MRTQYVTVVTIVARVGWLFHKSTGRLTCTYEFLQLLFHSMLFSDHLGGRASRGWTLLSVEGVLLLSESILTVAFGCLESNNMEQTYRQL